MSANPKSNTPTAVWEGVLGRPADDGNGAMRGRKASIKLTSDDGGPLDGETTTGPGLPEIVESGFGFDSDTSDGEPTFAADEERAQTPRTGQAEDKKADSDRVILESADGFDEVDTSTPLAQRAPEIMAKDVDVFRKWQTRVEHKASTVTTESSVQGSGSKTRAIAACQWFFALLAFGAFGFLLGGHVISADYICPAGTETPFKGIPPAHWPRPFEQRRVGDWIDTSSHIFAVILSIPLLGTALFLSLFLTVWTRWTRRTQISHMHRRQSIRSRRNSVNKSLEDHATPEKSSAATLVDSDNPCPSTNKPDSDATSTRVDVTAQAQHAHGFAENPSFDVAAHTADGEGERPFATHAVNGTGSSASATSSALPRKPHAVPPTSVDSSAAVTDSYQPPSTSGRRVHVLRWAVQSFLWLGYRREGRKRATTPQWVLFFFTLCTTYGVVAIFFGSGWTTFFKLAGIGTLALVHGFVLLLQYVQDSVLFRSRQEHPDTVRHQILRATGLSMAVLIVQVFLWCFFVGFAYATLPCLVVLKEAGNPSKFKREDLKYLDAVIKVRFWGTGNLSLHLLFLLVWLQLEFGSGRLSVAQLLRLRASPNALARVVLVALATLATAGSFSTVFAEQGTLLLTVKASEFVIPTFTIFLNAAVLTLWILTFITLLISVVRRKLRRKADIGRWNVFVSSCKDDAELQNLLATNIRLKSGDFLSRSHALSVGWRGKQPEADDPVHTDAENDHPLLHTDLYVPVLSWWRKNVDPEISSSTAARPVGSLADVAARTGGELDGDGGGSSSGATHMFLLELILAFELHRAHKIKRIFPILSGGLAENKRFYQDLRENMGELPDNLHGPTCARALELLKVWQRTKQVNLKLGDKPPPHWSAKTITTLVLLYPAFNIHEHGSARFANDKSVDAVLLAFERATKEKASTKSLSATHALFDALFLH